MTTGAIYRSRTSSTREVDIIPANGRFSIGLYAKNILDEVKHGGDTQLSLSPGKAPLGGTFSPLAKGRTFGVQLTYRHRS